MMRALPRLLPLLFAGLIAALSGCGEEADNTSTEIEARPALWQISDADTVIYVFGTFAFLPDNVRWFDGPVREAFDASEQLVIETVPPADANRQLEIFARSQDAVPLSGKLSPEALAQFNALLDEYQIDRASIDGADPWFAAMTLALLEYRRLGLDDANSAEFRLIAAAGEAGKFIVKIESYRDRLRALDSLPQPVQLAMLEAAIADFETLPDRFDRLRDSWAAGDVEGFAALMNGTLDDRPALRQAVLIDRNMRWADWIADRLDHPGTVFVAIGAERFAGDDSVLALLAARNVIARRLQ